MAAASAALDRFPADVALHPFVRAVASSLRRRCGVKAGDALLIAVSGGADSVALLRALHALHRRRTWRLRLTVGHVQHHLRDADGSGEADAAFVAALARQLDVPLLRRDLTLQQAEGLSPGSPVPSPPGNMEARARRARYHALAAMAREAQAAAVVVAHQADDQLETLLMRALRGASVAGLASMPRRRALARGGEEKGEGGDEKGARLLRPMLAVDRAGVVAFLRDVGQTWRDDPTNEDASRLRARLRRDVLPVLRDIRGDAPVRAVALCDHLRAARRQLRRDAVALRAAAQLPGQPADGASLRLSRSVLRGSSALVVGGLLREVLRDAGVPGDALGRRTLAPLIRAVRDRTGGVRRFGFAGGVRVEVTAKWVGVQRDNTENTASKPAR